MNNIEKNRIVDLDKALDYIMPSTVPSFLAATIKSNLTRMLNSEDIINKANTIYFATECEIYLEFYIKYLAMANEESSIIRIDNNAITMNTIFAKAENNESIPGLSFPGLIANMNDSVWLMLRNIKNIRLRNFIGNWRISNKLINEFGDTFIQLLPAVTCVHFDELYRAFCAYL